MNFDSPLSREGRYPRPSHSFIRALAWWFVAWLTLAVWVAIVTATALVVRVLFW